MELKLALAKSPLFAVIFKELNISSTRQPLLNICIDPEIGVGLVDGGACSLVKYSLQLVPGFAGPLNTVPAAILS